MTAALFLQCVGGFTLICVAVIVAIFALDKVLTEIGMVRKVWVIVKQRDRLRAALAQTEGKRNGR